MRFLLQAGRAVALAAAASVLGGCAIVASVPEHQAAERSGLGYMLPKALLPIELVEASGVLMLRLQPPVLVGDPQQRYLLQRQVSVTSDDDVKVEVDAATGLLSSVTVTSKDETLEVLKQIVVTRRAVSRESAGAATGEVVVFRGVYDPDGDADAVERNQAMLGELRDQLQMRVQHLSAGCRTPAALVEACGMLRQLWGELQSGRGLQIRATPLPSPGPLAGAPATAAADCSVGICHRLLRPFEVQLSIQGLFSQTSVVQLPNGTAPVQLPVERAAFVKSEHTVTLVNGQVQSVHTKRPSSALALVKWPLDVYMAVLQATSTLVALRIGANADDVKLAQSELDREKQLKAIREELEQLQKASNESSPRLSGSGPFQGDALLAFGLGPFQAAPKAAEKAPDKGGTPGKTGEPGAGLGGLGLVPTPTKKQ